MYTAQWFTFAILKYLFDESIDFLNFKKKSVHFTLKKITLRFFCDGTLIGFTWRFFFLVIPFLLLIIFTIYFSKKIIK